MSSSRSISGSDGCRARFATGRPTSSGWHGNPCPACCNHSTSDDAPRGVIHASTTINSQLSFADWLLSGLLVRYPNLKLAFSESQIGWMPFVMERVDRIWRVGNKVAEIDPIITEPPSSYAAGRVFGCFFEDDCGLEVRDRIGVDV